MREPINTSGGFAAYPTESKKVEADLSVTDQFMLKSDEDIDIDKIY